MAAPLPPLDPLQKYDELPVTSELAVGKKFLRLLELHTHTLHNFAHNASESYGHIFGWTKAEAPLIFFDAQRKHPVYSQTAHYCPMLFLSGQAVSAPGSLVIEMGTLSGASSRCLAAGLAVAAQSATAAAHPEAAGSDLRAQCDAQ